MLGPCPPRRLGAFKISYKKLEVREDCFLDSWDWEICWSCPTWTPTSQPLVDLRYKCTCLKTNPEGQALVMPFPRFWQHNPIFPCRSCSGHTDAPRSILWAAEDFRQVGQACRLRGIYQLSTEIAYITWYKPYPIVMRQLIMCRYL